MLPYWDGSSSDRLHTLTSELSLLQVGILSVQILPLPSHNPKLGSVEVIREVIFGVANQLYSQPTGVPWLWGSSSKGVCVCVCVHPSSNSPLNWAWNFFFFLVCLGLFFFPFPLLFSLGLEKAAPSLVHPRLCVLGLAVLPAASSFCFTQTKSRCVQLLSLQELLPNPSNSHICWPAKYMQAKKKKPNNPTPTHVWF